MEPIFGAHRIEDDAPDSQVREITTGQRGLVKFWRVRHGAQKVFVRGTARGPDEMRVLVRRFGAEKVLDLVRSGCLLLLAVEEGSAKLDLYNGPVVLGPGDALVVTAMEPFVFSTPGAFAAVWVELPVWWVIELCRGKMHGARRRLDGSRGTTTVLRSALHTLLEDGRDAEETDQLVDLFGDILARCLIIEVAEEADLPGPIDRINHFISVNFRTPGLAPPDAARALGCSLSSLHKSCAAVGATFGAMLANMRLSVAAYKLSRTSESISAIAYDCGFSSLPHFCHAFKARYGVTAGSLRRQHAARA
ncbi:MAG TPA: AraC family transcriptional regulator [Caulobacteraceae bacterium]|nr:AraC family transcriptional regulator [Caulobacteraceae bacterium]